MYKNIFVTGGAGVIGLQFIEILKQHNFNIYVGDLKSKPSSFGPKITYFQGDLNNFNEKIFEELKIEVVVHLAATFERSIESKNFYNDNFVNNIKLSNHILNFVRNSKTVRKFLFASSYLVYDSQQYISDVPNQESVNLNSNSKISPRNLIGASKFYIENEISFLQRFMEECTFVTPRIYRGYGLGSRDVISRWIRDSLKGIELEAYDVDGKFDYIYCKDAAMGIYKLLFESSYQGTVDLGSGKSESIRNIISTISSAIPSTSVKITNSTGNFESSQCDISLIKKITNWTPKYHLEQAVMEITEYERNLLGN